MLVKYGTTAIELKKEDDKNAEEEETTVIELICHEISSDELLFANPLYLKIFNLYMEGLSNNNLYESSYFKRLEDTEIVGLISDIESTQHELSPTWLSKYNIETKTEADHLYKTVITAIYNFKTYHIGEKIRSITKQLNSNTELSEEETLFLLNEQLNYEKVKSIFAKKLGRTILS